MVLACKAIRTMKRKVSPARLWYFLFANDDLSTIESDRAPSVERKENDSKPEHG